jgi:ubiquinone/menaquinone biosynthesis C-methylase UbiE
VIPLDPAVQTYSRGTLVHLGRSVTPNLFLLFGRGQRKDVVTAQFETGQQAREYANAGTQAPTQIDSQLRAARNELLHELLAEFPAGELLDAGCGPGVLVRSLLDSLAYDYRITMLDQSEAMIQYCVTHNRSSKTRAIVGDIESLPFDDGTFDVTVSTGALEYIDASAAVGQLSRVTRPGGAVIVSMLNPLSPYWLTDRLLYRPAVRILALTMRILGISHRHYSAGTPNGIRALRPGVLRRHLQQSGLVPVNVVFFGFTPLVRPFDRIAALRRWTLGRSGKLPVAEGWRRWMATGYVVVARRSGEQMQG